MHNIRNRAYRDFIISVFYCTKYCWRPLNMLNLYYNILIKTIDVVHCRCFLCCFDVKTNDINCRYHLACYWLRERRRPLRGPRLCISNWWRREITKRDRLSRLISDWLSPSFTVFWVELTASMCKFCHMPRVFHTGFLYCSQTNVFQSLDIRVFSLL